VHLDPPLRASVDAVPAFVTEASVSGALIAHETRFPAHQTHQLWFDWNEHTIRFEVEVVRTTVVRLARKPGEKSLYSTAVRLLDGDAASEKLLKELIAEYVVRAINEQLANARGIPPLAAYSYQTGKGNRFRRCELVNGVWRKSETSDPTQPVAGFTISAEVDPRDVDLLCETWQRVDDKGKALTQLLAQLSISKAEGIPTRRYVP
jgi:hypothetical protein